MPAVFALMAFIAKRDNSPVLALLYVVRERWPWSIAQSARERLHALNMRGFGLRERL